MTTTQAWTRESAAAQQAQYAPIVTVNLRQAWEDQAESQFTFKMKILTWRDNQAVQETIDPPVPPVEPISVLARQDYMKRLRQYEADLGGALLVKALQEAGEFLDLRGDTLVKKFADLCAVLPNAVIEGLVQTVRTLMTGRPGKVSEHIFPAKSLLGESGTNHAALGADATPVAKPAA